MPEVGRLMVQAPPEGAATKDRPWAMEGSPDEAPKDPAARQNPQGGQPQGPAGGLTERDTEEINSHRHLYVGFHLPGKGKRAEGSGKHHHGGHHGGGHHGGGHHHHSKRGHGLKPPPENIRPVTPPAQRVQFILGQESQDVEHETHPVFSEMEELIVGEDGNMEWKETARWVKFEEDVEEGGNRWSKPHVATLSLHSLFELRSLLLNGTVSLDMAASSLDEIADLTLDNMINCGSLPRDKKDQVKAAMLKKHRHQFEGLKKEKHLENGSNGNNMSKLPIIRSLADIGKSHSSSKSASSLPPGQAGTDPSLPRNPSDENVEDHHKVNSHFMKKIPKGAEASNILVGEVDFLEKPLSAFIRLQEATILGDLTEVPVPTRFLFVLLGPFGGIQKYHEIGRAVATVMSDEVFHDVAYKAKKRDHLLAGLDEFLDAVTVLPPGEWDPSIRIEPPNTVPSQEGRKHPSEAPKHIDEEEEEQKMREEAGLTRTGRLFGGLINDIKRKKPWYLTDFKDAISMQCVASYVFIYFACLTPIITFGGLLGDATKNNIASMESLVSGLIVGTLYGMFSAQPLTILGSTGPVLVFETIVYTSCESLGWDYLSFRLWIGLWTGLILLVLVATDASAYVCYITRFTEENFATLIAVIFIISALQKVADIGKNYPISKSSCFCDPSNETWKTETGWNSSWTPLDETTLGTRPMNCSASVTLGQSSATVLGQESVGCHYVPNAFLMSVLLFVGTFLISHHLKKFKAQNFFSTFARKYISDFAVVIAIVSMTCTDMMVGVATPKLTVPDRFAPTLSTRGWLVPPLNGNPVYTPVLACVPAVLASILLFMDQQITAVIVNRKEHKLKKGGGYHLDLLIVAVCIIICSVLGLPWFVAATVLSINHVKSLHMESASAAPGEKPSFLGIREQRATHVLIFITVGLSVFLTPILSKIPMPVLYGVFLYMGVSSLDGLQFFDRMLLFLMPKKFQPDYPYLRHVQLERVHLYTLIQIGCFVALWLIKSFSQTSILFPLMLVVIVFVRKSLDYVFTKKELQVLDDILPEFHRHDRLDDEEALQQDPADVDRRPSSALRFTETGVEIPMVNGGVIKIPNTTIQQSDINITEEMNKSGCWKSLEPQNSADCSEGLKKRHKDRKMSLVKEDAEEEVGLICKIGSQKAKNKKRDETTDEEETKSLVSSQ